MARRSQRLRQRDSEAGLRRRARGGGTIQISPLGLVAARTLHVGFGADRPRLPQALLLLLRVAHRWPKTTPARLGHGDQRNRRAAAAGLSLHRAGLRHFLSLLAY